MRFAAVMASVILVLSPISWGAASHVIGVLRATGIVMTNSVPMPDGGTICEGDLIRTAPGSSAVIASRSGRVEIRENSEAQLRSGGVKLLRGAAASAQIPIDVGGYTVRPRNAAAGWFAVSNRNGRIVVAAHRGDLLIASAYAPQVVVPEGSVAEQEQDHQQDSQQQPKEQDSTRSPTERTAARRKTHRKAAAAAGGAAGGWSMGSLSHAASVAALAGVAVAGTVAGTAVALSESGPSPDH
jgi:hypothetical protein